MRRLKQRFGFHITACWHAWCTHEDRRAGDDSGVDRGDPYYRTPDFIERFLETWHDANRSSSTWERIQRITVDWDKERRLLEENKKRSGGGSDWRGGGSRDWRDWDRRDHGGRRDRDDRAVRQRHGDR